MAIKLLEPANRLIPDWYTPASDRELNEDEATRFKLQPLTGEEMDIALHGMKTPIGQVPKMNDLTPETVRFLLRKGVVDWTNAYDANGNDVKFNRGELARLQPNLRLELAWELIRRSQITQEVEKNSPSQPK